MIKYNLGSGPQPKPGFINVDLKNADIDADLNCNWVFASDNSADFVLSAHVFEHLKDPIHTMNELYRILKPGGRAEIHVPSTDGRGAFQDPTHVSFWNINSFQYYSSTKNPAWHNLCQTYGFKGDFTIHVLEDYKVGEIVVTKAVLEK